MVECNLVVVVRAITSFSSVLMRHKKIKIYTFILKVFHCVYDNEYLIEVKKT